MRRTLLLPLLLLLPAFTCAHEMTPEERETVVALKKERDQVLGEIQAARMEAESYSGGLVKALVAARLQILKTNEALLQQRIHALESGAPVTVTTQSTEPDPERAASLARAIEEQRRAADEARAEASRYSGGLLQGLALTNVGIAEATIAMLEQQRVISEHGLAPPGLAREAEALAGEARAAASTEARAAASTEARAAASTTPQAPPAKDCLRVEELDSSVLSTNNAYTELSWKVDVANDCDEDLPVLVKFTIYDAQEFELDSDQLSLMAPAHGIGKARDTMLVSPPEKARRMARQGATVSLR